MTNSLPLKSIEHVFFEIVNLPNLKISWFSIAITMLVYQRVLRAQRVLKIKSYLRRISEVKPFAHEVRNSLPYLPRVYMGL